MTLREFLRLNLTELQRRSIYAQCPALAAGIDDRTIDDRDLVLRIIRHDEEALWLLWFCLKSSFFVRIIRMRSKNECGQPCSLVDFETLPCRWSERVLGDFYARLTTAGAGVLEAYCVEGEQPDLGIMDWLAIRLHEEFHVEMLRTHGFAPLDEHALPPSLRALFARDARFRTIFINRWLWGLIDVEDMAEAVKPPLPGETLANWINLVDGALLSAPETGALVAQLEDRRRQRARSGIPPRPALAPRSRST
jgi:hypothetical protein